LTPPRKRTVQRTNHRPAHKHECYSLIAVSKATVLQNFSTPGALVVELLQKMWSGGFRKNCQLRRSVNRPGMSSICTSPIKSRCERWGFAEASASGPSSMLSVLCLENVLLLPLVLLVAHQGILGLVGAPIGRIARESERMFHRLLESWDS
jgi:hypothetical protein